MDGDAEDLTSVVDFDTTWLGESVCRFSAFDDADGEGFIEPCCGDVVAITVEG